MYAATDTWKAYQPFLPSALRCEGDRESQEEYWAWRGHDVHLDRHANEPAPVKLIALHGGGGNGRLMAPAGVAAREVAETVARDLPGYGHTRIPVLLTHPGDDRWTPAHLSRSFLERIAAPTTYVELANCGHFPIEEPGISTMNASVISFIRSLLDDTTSTQ